MNNRSHSLLSDSVVSRQDRSLVTQVVKDRAVRFGEGVRNADCKAFPFFYNFTKYPYQEGIANPTTGIYSIVGDSAEGPDGLLIPAGGRLTIPIVMDNDYPFHLLNLKWGAYYKHAYVSEYLEGSLGFPSDFTPVIGMEIIFNRVPGASIAVNTPYYITSVGAASFMVALTIGGPAVDLGGSNGTYYWTLAGLSGSNPWGSRAYMDFDPFHDNLILNAYANRMVPFYTELDVSLYFPSSGGRDLYGGFQRAPLLGATEEQPLPIGDLQGRQDGFNGLRTPYQLPAGAHVDIRVKSRSSYPLYVYGHLFGYKIAV